MHIVFADLKGVVRMFKDVVKFVILVAITLVAGVLLRSALAYVDNEWTKASMEQVSNNMGDQIAIRRTMDFWNLAKFFTWVIGVCAIVAPWLFVYRGQLKQKVVPALVLVLLPMTMAGCRRDQYNTVIITPPNYAIVINMNKPKDQAVGNDFSNGELVNVSQVTVQQQVCVGGIDANDYCPDKLVAQVPGAPQSRIYTQDKNSGTSGSNQALCFESHGTNGCLDFSVTAIVDRDNAQCYANKMGVTPEKDADGKPSRYSYLATPLTEALDTRVMQIAGAEFAKASVGVSPLEMANQKFTLFETAKPHIIDEVKKQTCITILNAAINGGIVWSSDGVQHTIDQATILENQRELARLENEVGNIQVTGVISRVQALKDRFGTGAATQLFHDMKWNGTYGIFSSAQSVVTGTTR